MRQYAEANHIRETVQPFIPDHSIFNTDADENIFIVQLESVNGLLADGKLVFNEETYENVSFPQLEKIAEDGILFPLAWSNSIQTNRSQVSILCGIVGNIGTSFSFVPEKISTMCLPAILKLSGYKSIFYWSYYNIYFQGRKYFSEAAGFDELLLGTHLAKPNDIRYEWGYDDCTFYERSFEKIQQERRDKIFAYFEVSSHHYPFKSQKKLEDTHLFHNPKNIVETYTNSALQQDQCLGKFYELFKKYAGSNSHLFILADNGWPLQSKKAFIENGATTQHFLVPFIYVPPINRKSEFLVHTKNSTMISTSDLIPTIFDLLNSTYYPGSFADILRIKPIHATKYDDCHLLIQPYGEREIVIIHKDKKYVYSFAEKNISFTDLQKDINDLHPKIIDENVEYEDFNNKYACKRYKQNMKI